MVFRRALSAIVVVFIAAISGLAMSSSAQADAGFIYKCSGVAEGQSKNIPYSRIWDCSSGPADTSIVQKVSIDTGKQVAWISGECAFYAYHQLGWRNMDKIWTHCLGHKPWPLCGSNICSSKRVVPAARLHD